MDDLKSSADVGYQLLKKKLITILNDMVSRTLNSAKLTFLRELLQKFIPDIQNDEFKTKHTVPNESKSLKTLFYFLLTNLNKSGVDTHHRLCNGQITRWTKNIDGDCPWSTFHQRKRGFVRTKYSSLDFNKNDKKKRNAILVGEASDVTVTICSSFIQFDIKNHQGWNCH